MSPIFHQVAKCFFISLTIMGSTFLLGCSSLLYYPTRALYVDVKKMNPPPEDLEFFLPDHTVIHGWRLSQDKSLETKGSILFFHGNGQNRSAHFLMLYWLVKEGFDLFIFDYPGYGQTAGRPTPENTVTTARGAIEFVLQKYPDRPLIVYGHSLGGAIALRAMIDFKKNHQTVTTAFYHEPQLVVIDSSFLSYQEIGRKTLARSLWTWWMQPLSYLLLSDRWAPSKATPINLSPIPVLVMHSKKDEVIPYELGIQLGQSIQSEKEIWLKNTGAHNETFDNPEGKKLRVKFLEYLKLRIEKTNYKKSHYENSPNKKRKSV